MGKEGKGEGRGDKREWKRVHNLKKTNPPVIRWLVTGLNKSEWGHKIYPCSLYYYIICHYFASLITVHLTFNFSPFTVLKTVVLKNLL